jgi:hypothetical protein
VLRGLDIGLSFVLETLIIGISGLVSVSARLRLTIQVSILVSLWILVRTGLTRIAARLGAGLWHELQSVLGGTNDEERGA